ncbi:MAG TPA: LLM class flavin-dependent oxidoreductase [Candidatus Limnocylindrales bacterium]|jgi:alkanesulfonate monooxygenase SsuD/methylene tetrahydromethanopterin reductase-like flavin-dependent oxidoreductase (luciferase family)
MADDTRLKIGLSLPTWPGRDGLNVGWSVMRRLARDVESLGVDTLWVPDHLMRVIPGRPPIGFWECWTILSAAADATTRIEVGPFVACTGFRNPALLAKMAATLDEVSAGRLVLGLGSGVPASDDSWRAFGYDDERHVGKHAEAVEIVARMLREPPVTFEGGHYRTDGAEALPRGPRPTGIPLWIAGKGERTMRIAARWGDAVNVNTTLSSAADVAEIAEQAAAACAAVGRNPASLELTGYGRIALKPDGSADERPGWIGGSREAMVATMRSLGAAGLQHLTLYVGEADDPSPLPALTGATLERFAPLFEALRAG